MQKKKYNFFYVDFFYDERKEGGGEVVGDIVQEFVLKFQGIYTVENSRKILE